MPAVALALSSAFGASVGVVWLLLRARRLPVDVPDGRRLHTRPTPRGGGLGIAVGVLFAILLLILTGLDDLRALAPVLLFATLNGMLGFIDDRRPMRSRVKFVIQVGFAALAYAQHLRLSSIALPYSDSWELGWLAWPATVLWLVWFTNAFNFMDGLDSLAAGTALVWSAALAAAAWGAPLGLLSIALAGATAGFLLFNLPPARIFMGDVGSFFIGALVGAALLQTASTGHGLPLRSGILLCGTFVWDATYTIVFRAVRGEDWLRPHRRHLFQRLILSGVSSSAVRLGYLAAATVFAALALVCAAASPWVETLILGLSLTACLAFSMWVGRIERRAILEHRHPDIQSPEEPQRSNGH